MHCIFRLDIVSILLCTSELLVPTRNNISRYLDCLFIMHCIFRLDIVSILLCTSELLVPTRNNISRYLDCLFIMDCIFRLDVVSILLCTSELLVPTCSNISRYVDVTDAQTPHYSIHNHCTSLLAALAVVASPLDVIYK